MECKLLAAIAIGCIAGTLIYWVGEFISGILHARQVIKYEEKFEREYLEIQKEFDDYMLSRVKNKRRGL